MNTVFRAPDPNRPWYRYAERLVPAGSGRWIDLGCGHGEFLSIIERRDGRSGFGLDRKRPSAKNARTAGHPTLVADLARPLPFTDASLDGVTLLEVIEHLPEAEALIDEIARVLRPGGWLVLTTPNVAHLTYRIRALTGHPPKQEGYHFRFFTARTLRAALQARGLHTEARASYGKQALLTKLRRLRNEIPKHDKVHYWVPQPFEPLLAQHFVWRLTRD